MQGLRVLDLSRYIAGPYAAMLLADHGAEVIKVEKPQGGEETRQQEPQVGGESLYYMMFNRNKRGITLDLRMEEGRALLLDLAREADVLIEGFKPGTMEKLGCGWPVLHAANPLLVMARISGFGQDGPYAPRPCFDPLAQAMSGIMAQTGEPDGVPTMSGILMADYGTGLYALIGILMALRDRERTGVGQLVDCALLDSAVTFLASAIPEYLLLNRKPARHGNRSRYVAPNECFPTKDGALVYIVGGHQGTFENLARLMQREDLLADPKFAQSAARFANYDAIAAIVADWTRDQEADVLLSRLEGAGVPAGKVATVEDIVVDPQVRHRQMIAEVEHPAAGKVPMPGINIKLSHTPGTIRRPPPRLGEHTAEVLEAWLGMSHERIEAIRARGVI